MSREKIVLRSTVRSVGTSRGTETGSRKYRKSLKNAACQERMLPWKDLNRSIKRQHLKLPTREEVMSRFAGAQIFSKMDAFQGFYQLGLDEESSKLCTFNAPFGHCRYLRLPFEISSAPEVHTSAIRTIFEGISNFDNSVDDIIVWGRDKQEHDTSLQRVLQAARENNLRLNKAKCHFGVKELTFFGSDVLSAAEQKPDPSNVTVIKDMRLHDGRSWSKTGTFVGIHPNPRSYMVKRDDGMQLDTAAE